MSIVLKPFAWLLLMLYNMFSSYGIALFLFALVVKVILFPFSLKGKKSMIQMNMLSGKMQQIQKKYANDRERQNAEIQQLYAREKVSPMGGCLWSLLPLFILIPLYAVIREPFYYLMDLTKDQLPNLVNVLNGYTTTAINQTSPYFQLEAAHVLFQNFNAVVADPAVSAIADNLIKIDFNFLGANLAAVPNWQFWAGGLSWNSIALFLIPVVSAVTGLIFSQVTMKTNAVNNQSAEANNNPSMKMMMWMTPLMSLWIGFTMPAGLSIYWIANNVLAMGQEFIAGKILKKDYEAAAATKAEQERLEKDEEKRQRREAAERKAQAIEDAKKNKGKKKIPLEKKYSDASKNEASKVGMRAYARGRAYDPQRYSSDGPTLYTDPGAPVDENAVEKALEKKAGKLEATALEMAADDMIMDKIILEKGLNASTEHEETNEGESAEYEPETEDPENQDLDNQK